MSRGPDKSRFAWEIEAHLKEAIRTVRSEYTDTWIVVYMNQYFHILINLLLHDRLQLFCSYS